MLSPAIDWQKELILKQQELQKICSSCNGPFEFAFLRKLLEYWEILYRNYLCLLPETSRRNARQQAVYQAIQYIQENYQNKIYLKDIAAACSMSTSECCRIFRQQLDISPREYVVKYRINQSLELLEDPQLSVTQICDRVGFENHSYFTKTFRKIMNCTPREYRRREQN